MILPMAKVRILGPRDCLDGALRAVQDVGLLHLADPPDVEGLAPIPPTPRAQRRRRQLERLLDDVDAALRALAVSPRPARAEVVTLTMLSRWARLARRVRGTAEALAANIAALADERALLLKYRDVLETFRPLIEGLGRNGHLVTHAAVLPATQRAAVEQLAAQLRDASHEEIAVTIRVLRSGELAVLIVLPARTADRVDRLLTEARLPELRLPERYGATLSAAFPAMRERLAAIPREEHDAQQALARHAREYAAQLAMARTAAHDALSDLAAHDRCGVTSHAFALEGWLPERQVAHLAQAVERSCGPLVTVTPVGHEQWQSHDAPVVLSNPRIIRPFEMVVRMMPLPTYGTIDPTPFVALFFPMFIGLAIGDLAYGLALGGIAAVLFRKTVAGSAGRMAAEIAAACALFASLFGVLFGEFLGDLGRTQFGMRHILFDREEAVIPFLIVAIALGGFHVALGLVLGVVAKWRHERKHALGSGLTLVMLVLLTVALLATVDILPRGVVTPAVVALLVAFPVLVVLEGIVAPIELLATVGNILSYARLMALGIAGVMMAVVANEMAGAMGSAVAGIGLALLFHVVNFAIALFSPTIHVARLHYVEFFGKFYAPGGHPYRPFGHWTPGAGG